MMLLSFMAQENGNGCCGTSFILKLILDLIEQKIKCESQNGCGLVLFWNNYFLFSSFLCQNISAEGVKEKYTFSKYVHILLNQ